MGLSNCCIYVRPCPSAGDWSSGLSEIYVYYWDEMTHSPYYKMKIGFVLVDKSDDIVDICGTTNINKACVCRFGEIMGLLCYGI